jgi:hypothetical protein
LIGQLDGITGLQRFHPVPPIDASFARSVKVVAGTRNHLDLLLVG